MITLIPGHCRNSDTRNGGPFPFRRSIAILCVNNWTGNPVSTWTLCDSSNNSVWMDGDWRFKNGLWGTRFLSTYVLGKGEHARPAIQVLNLNMPSQAPVPTTVCPRDIGRMGITGVGKPGNFLWYLVHFNSTSGVTETGTVKRGLDSDTSSHFLECMAELPTSWCRITDAAHSTITSTRAGHWTTGIRRPPTLAGLSSSTLRTAVKRYASGRHQVMRRRLTSSHTSGLARNVPISDIPERCFRSRGAICRRRTGPNARRVCASPFRAIWRAGGADADRSRQADRSGRRAPSLRGGHARRQPLSEPRNEPPSSEFDLGLRQSERPSISRLFAQSAAKPCAHGSAAHRLCDAVPSSRLDALCTSRTSLALFDGMAAYCLGRMRFALTPTGSKEKVTAFQSRTDVARHRSRCTKSTIMYQQSLPCGERSKARTSLYSGSF